MSKIEPGVLVQIVGHDKDCQYCSPYLGLIREVARPSAIYESFWLLDPPTVRAETGQTIAWSPKHLRPINPGDGEDEILRIAGRPQEVAA